MFTGIITHIGTLIEKKSTRCTFRSPLSFTKKLHVGTSVAVNGACLTVIDKLTTNAFSVELMAETIRKTVFHTLAIGDAVNLELPANPETFLSGHIVQGHIDGVGSVKNVRKAGNSRVLTISIPEQLARYIVEKGSIAINGVSLTVIDTNDTSFVVGITPYTWSHTTFHMLRVGDTVNIEVDILAKYLYAITKS